MRWPENGLLIQLWFRHSGYLRCGDSIPAKLGYRAAGRNCNLRLTCITESWNLVFLVEGRRRQSARSSALAIAQSRLTLRRTMQTWRLVSCLKRSISGNPRERYRTFFCFFWFCCRAIISCLPLELAGFVCCLFFFALWNTKNICIWQGGNMGRLLKVQRYT